jgi:hypothetical protein
MRIATDDEYVPLFYLDPFEDMDVHEREYEDDVFEQRGVRSNVYEVNPWLWQFGLGKPRLGGLTIKETSERKDDVSNA